MIMKAIYTINGEDFRDFGVIVHSVEGLFDNLEMVDMEIQDNPGQHGSIADLSGIRYQSRKISLGLYFYTPGEAARDRRAAFMAEFIGTTPKRLERTEGDEIRFWDVIPANGSTLTSIRTRLEDFTLKLIELAPIKEVYRASGSSVSFTLAPKTAGQTQQPVLISWGDGTFSDHCRSGEFTKTYTDGSTTHYVILSGVMDEVTITTQQTRLYGVRY